VLAAANAVTAPARGGTGLYARVPSRDQEAGLGRQAARLTAWAAQSGRAVVRAGHRDRPGRVNTGLVEAALSAHGRGPARNRAGKARRHAARGTGPASGEVAR